MRQSLFFAIALIGLGLSADPGRSEGLVARPIIAGMPVSCSDFRGIVVRTMQLTELGDVASARIMGRIPVILMDVDRMAKLPQTLQLFFYGHECAHHVLGHSFAATTSSENEADCWSIKHGRDTGLFTRDDVISWAPFFAHSRGSQVGHLPGPKRAKRLIVCYDDLTNELVNPEVRNDPEEGPNPPVVSASTGG